MSLCFHVFHDVVSVSFKWMRTKSEQESEVESIVLFHSFLVQPTNNYLANIMTS